ncbi:MAG: sulfotransferase domain-containing protein [Planctomycetota bacterium]
MTEPSSIERVIGKAKRTLSRGRSASPVEVAAPSDPSFCEFEAERQGRKYKLFFMVGFPRSGTNWCGAVINRHPKAHIHGEYHFEMLKKGFKNLVGYPWHAASGGPYQDIAWACFRDNVRKILVEGARFRRDAEWIGDRTPRTLDVFLPGAPHILMLRDPRDVLVSFLHHDLRNGGFVFGMPAVKAKANELRERFLADDHLFKREPELLMSVDLYVRRAVEQMKFYAETNIKGIERSNRGELGAPLLVVRYEQLHADPDGERAKIYEFLGLDPSEAEPLDTSSKSRPGLEREDPAGMYRKGKTGSWRENFTPRAEAIFREVMGDTMAPLGYDLTGEW